MKFDIDGQIKEIEAQMIRLDERRQFLMALRGAGAVIELPDAEPVNAERNVSHGDFQLSGQTQNSTQALSPREESQ